MRRLPLICVVLILLIINGCGRNGQSKRHLYTRYENLVDKSKQLPFGEDNDVYLFTGEVNLTPSAQTLQESVCRKITLTVDEQFFYLISKNESDLQDYLAYKNLLLLGSLDQEDAVSVYLRRTLAPDLIARVKKGEPQLYVVKNLNARDQLILCLLAANPAQLEELVRQRADQIFSYLLERYQQRLAYQAYTNEVIAPDFYRERPFTIQIPVLYQIFRDDKPGRFLSFVYQAVSPKRSMPDKYVSVYHEPMPENVIDADWLFAKRQEITDKYFKGDELVPGKAQAERVKIAGQNGWKIYGHWINRQQSGGVGGAFQTFAFWHQPTKTAYLVDNLVYYPDGDKLPVLLELGMLAQSLSVK